MRVWVTRTAPDAQATAARLRAMGHYPLVAPVLEIRVLPGPAPNLDGVTAIAFTSRNGVAAFAALTAERGLPVFAVGPSTAEAARDKGFQRVEDAAGDVTALAGLIRRRRAVVGAGHVLHPGPEKPAGDLVAALAQGGVAARLHPVYATDALPLPPAAAAALAAAPPGVEVVLVHSPRAGRTLAGYPQLARAASSLIALCISPVAAATLADLPFDRIDAAARPDEDALMDLVDRTAARP